LLYFVEIQFLILSLNLMNKIVLKMFVLIIDMKDLNRNISIRFVKYNDRDMLDEIDNENHEELNRI
jgi:hypothetical protein